MRRALIYFSLALFSLPPSSFCLSGQYANVITEGTVANQLRMVSINQSMPWRESEQEKEEWGGEELAEMLKV